MSIIKTIEKDNYKIAIWKIEESLEELQKLASNISTSHIKSTKRKIEYLITRILLAKKSPNTNIHYNEFGAPFLNTGDHISISHSKELVAIILSKIKTGIDIEKISNKTLLVSEKFINKGKRKNLTQEKATIIWSAKEAIYKWHQRKKINFTKDIKLSNFKVEQKGVVKAYFKEEKLMIKYEKINTHYLVYVCK